ncbi:MAG: hypothetical protein K8R02_02785 [Anaerohalosphaeraceae bacterium]|nr:hypothetical protein [Anaerohalosphaeraceae bacterium]
MSNRTDFFLPQKTKASALASVAAVYIDGRYFDCLTVEKITYAAELDFSKAEMSFCVGNDIDCDQITPGQLVAIKTTFDSGIGESLPQELCLFAGAVEEIKSRTETERNFAKIIARDYSVKMERKTVFGRNTVCDNETVFLNGLETVFNPDGQPNASKTLATDNCRHYTVFSTDEISSRYFTCAEAIYYILCQHIPFGQIAIPTIEWLEELCQNHIIRDVNVTGLNVIAALQRCCRQAGLKFKFSTICNKGAVTQGIVFFRPGCGAETEVNFPADGEKISSPQTNIISAKQNIKTDFTKRYSVQGDFKTYEATFELVKAWDNSLETIDYDEFSPLTNPDFQQVQNVYRKWCLNEAGDYSKAPYNQGETFDFSKIFEKNASIKKHRRFYPCISADENGALLGYKLEVSYIGGDYWWDYSGSFDLLLDECGIWISDQQIEHDMWFAILKGLLKFRITACIISDERITARICDGPTESTAEIVDKMTVLPARFKYRKVSPYSIFYNGSKNTTGKNQIDDSSAIVEFARKSLQAWRSESQKIEIKTARLEPGFRVGDNLMAAPQSRDFLKMKYDTASKLWITKVKMDFTNQQTTLCASKVRI